jgi:hypothetical protein
MQKTKRAKGSKRRQPPRSRGSRHPATLSNGWTLEAREGPPLSENVVQASLPELLAAFESVPTEIDWDWAQGRVLPVLPRARPQPAGSAEPIQAVMSGGITVQFGIDIGPAFMSVSAKLLRQWAKGVADLAATAIVNLHARAGSIEPGDLYHGSLSGIATTWLQSGRSVASTLVLAPLELTRLLGPEPQLLVAPMRDLLIAFPGEPEVELAMWLHAEIAAEDPNCLPLAAFRLENGGVSMVPLIPELALDLPFLSFGAPLS